MKRERVNECKRDHKPCSLTPLAIYGYKKTLAHKHAQPHTCTHTHTQLRQNLKPPNMVTANMHFSTFPPTQTLWVEACCAQGWLRSDWLCSDHAMTSCLPACLCACMCVLEHAYQATSCHLTHTPLIVLWLCYPNMTYWETFFYLFILINQGHVLLRKWRLWLHESKQLQCYHPT